MSIDLKNIEKLLELGKKYRLAEFGIEDGKTKVQFKFRDASASINASVTKNAAMPVIAAPAPGPVVLQPSTERRVSQGSDTAHKIVSPFVGTFYRAPSPDAEPYAKEGQTIRKGDALCIVEAMKLMNEIECDVSGKIISVLAENGQPVEYGEPLFLIELL